VLLNPGLTKLITDAIVTSWTHNLETLRLLDPMADDAASREEWRLVKQKCRDAPATEILNRPASRKFPQA
jgi:glucan phosphorylase